MTEPEPGTPLEGGAAIEAEPECSAGTERRIWPYLIGAVLILGLGTGAAFFFLSRPGPSFEALLTVTEAAETDRQWFDYFIAQDCFATAVLDLGDPDLAFTDGLELLEETDRMATHVAASLAEIDGVSIRGWHGEIVEAREAIRDHYVVWDVHLAEVDRILLGLGEDIGLLASVFDDWLDEVIEAGTPIEDTYLAAEDAFLAAAPDEDFRQDVETLFTPSDITCSRGAV